MNEKLDRRSIAAWLLGGPEELKEFKEYGDHVVVLNQAGQKFTFDNNQVELAATACLLEQAQEFEAKKPGTRKTRKRRKGTKRHEHTCTDSGSG